MSSNSGYRSMQQRHKEQNERLKRRHDIEIRRLREEQQQRLDYLKDRQFRERSELIHSHMMEEEEWRERTKPKKRKNQDDSKASKLMGNHSVYDDEDESEEHDDDVVVVKKPKPLGESNIAAESNSSHDNASKANVKLVLSYIRKRKQEFSEYSHNKRTEMQKTPSSEEIPSAQQCTSKDNEKITPICRFQQTRTGNLTDCEEEATNTTTATYKREEETSQQTARLTDNDANNDDKKFIIISNESDRESHPYDNDEEAYHDYYGEHEEE